MSSARRIHAASLATALAASCGGGQTQGLAFDPRWANDNGAAIHEIARQLADEKIPPGADVAIGVIDDRDGTALVGVPLRGGKAWTYPHALDSRPVVAGTVVVGLGRGQLFALDAATGRPLWTRTAGGRLRGAGDDGRTTVISLMSTTGRGSAVLAITHDGEVIRQIEDRQAIGAPAIAGRYAFLPWQGQYVTVFDLQSGEEVARALLRTEVSRAFAVGGALFFGGAAATRVDDHVRFAARGLASTVTLPARDLPGEPRWMVPGTEVLAPTATASDKVHLYARPSASGPPAIDGGRFVATYFRVAIGFDAVSGRVTWAHTAKDDFLGGAAYAGGFALCDTRGRVTFLEGTHGAAIAEASLGRPIAACIVQVDGYTPPRRTPAAAPDPLSVQLARVVTMPAAELTAIQRVLLQDLAALPDDTVTQALIDLASSPRTSPLLLEDARRALAARRSGAPLMLAALRRRYDFLADVLRPPPVGPLATALAAMGERRAAPMLARHLNDPSTPTGDLEQVAASLSTIASLDELPALKTFFALYRGVEDEALAGAVVRVAEALMKLGGADIVARAAQDSYTSPTVKPQLARLTKERGLAGSASAGAR